MVAKPILNTDTHEFPDGRTTAPPRWITAK